MVHYRSDGLARHTAIDPNNWGRTKLNRCLAEGCAALRSSEGAWLRSRRRGYSRSRAGCILAERLEEAGRAAHAAEARHDEAAAGEAWRRYRLIRDAGRDPDELLAEGIALSNLAIALASFDRPRK